MKFGLVGFGKMGKAIKRIAEARSHQCVWIADRSNPLEKCLAEPVDVVFEFSQPNEALRLVQALLEADCRVVSGTTGWSLESLNVDVLNKGAFLHASNFSLGIYWLNRLVATASEWIGEQREFKPFIHELHHLHKLDGPSGTAKQLAMTLASHDPRKLKPMFGDVKKLEDNNFHVSYTRVGAEPGTHTVGWDGPLETLELTHRAKDRDVFAQGAVIVGEWIQNKSGVFTLGDALRA